jgi:DNA-binding winged helix-turn-helix (wHTH) protein/tetratricopeptide (TPR) repeat protein
MATQPQSTARLVFGPFELNVAAGELLKSGVRIRLPGQPFQILLLLLGHPGDVVTREQLREQIWRDGTFVDFEHGLNVAMNKLRRTLGDSAERPRYIETVPGLGYRFLGTVQNLGVSGTSSAGLRIISENGAVVPEERQTKARQPRRKWFIAIAACLAISALAGSAFFYFHRKPVLTAQDAIVLADFVNKTGDPVFDGTLRQGLAIQLQQSPFLRLVSDERIQKELRLMVQAPDGRLTPELGREICERSGGVAVLDGSIEPIGNQYVLGLRAKNCSTGDVLDQEQVQAARKEDVLKALSQIATKFRTRVGESLATIEKHNAPLAEATTPSLEALKAYSAAEKVHSATSVPLYKHAIEIDPKFAMAYASLGQLYGKIGESDLSAESISKAYELRDRASDREKYFLTLSYYFRVTGNLERAQQTCELWAQTYSSDALPPAFLSVIYDILGNYDAAVEESRKTIQLDPDFPFGYANLAFGYQNLNRLKDDEDTLQRAAARKLEFPDFAYMRYIIAFLRADQAGMERAVAQGKSGSEDLIANQALALAYTGHLQQARTMSRRAVDLAQQAGQRESAALYETGAALQEAFSGNAPAARRRATAALELSKNREVEYGAAFVMALSGDSSRSKLLANDLERRFPEDTSVKFNYMPVLRALLNHGEPSKAIDLLQMAVPYELGTPRCTIHGFFGALYPVYARGEAYLAARQGRAAAAEFQKILDHPGAVASDPIGALAHLELGRALVLSGDKGKAKGAYRDFLTLWKDADSDIPIFKQAQAEYAWLQ